MKALAVTTEEAIANFAAEYAEVRQTQWEEIQRLAKRYVGLIDTHPDAKQKLCELYPIIERRALDSLERVGRGTVIPELAYGEASAGRAALAKMPPSDQAIYLKQGVPLVLLRDSKVEILNVEIDNLKPEQVRQVFDRGSIRSEGAQRAWLENKLTNTIPVIVEQDYKVTRGGVEFLRRSKVSWATLAQILAQRPE